MPRPITTHAGDRFGMLTVVERVPSRLARTPRFLCQCDCGNVSEVYGSHLRKGSVRSCGCNRADAQRASVTTHGMSKTPTHITWTLMKQRCLNPKAPDFHKYGGRGVTVCDRWLSFENFLADMGERPDGMTLDRIDNDGPYGPDNCRWATPTDQQANRRRTVMLTIGSETKPLAELARLHGLPPKTVYMRVRYAWSPEQALGIHPRPRS